jgi:hypothetical protein
VTWALDLGTTNTAVARWDEDSGEPRLVSLPRLCRRPRGEDPLEAPGLVPSVVQMLEPASLVDRLGSWRRLERFRLWGRAALIGRPALERNAAIVDPAYVPGFKAALALDPLRSLARGPRAPGRRLAAAGTSGGARQQGSLLGGNAVDGWLLEIVCERMGYALEDLPDDEQVRLWRRLMLAEACRVKESLFFRPVEEFLLTPPGLARRVSRKAEGTRPLQLTRDDLVETLRQRGFYAALASGLEGVLSQAAEGKLGPEAVDDVLVVGGSTLLPGVFAQVEERFGRARVRAWHPFEAVVKGAASFAADRYAQLDFIVHDYAFVTYDAKTHEPVHTVVVPRGTRFPTHPDFWRAQLVPTCSLGAPEALFKLLVCEIGSRRSAHRGENRRGARAPRRQRRQGPDSRRAPLEPLTAAAALPGPARGEGSEPGRARGLQPVGPPRRRALPAG